LILYCFIVLVVMILLNTLLFPRLMRQEITQVDYGTFLTMLKVAVAQVEQDVIYFVDTSEEPGLYARSPSMTPAWWIACAASGASGAKLANMVNEAALRAVRQGRRLATREDLQESIEVVIAGYQKKNKILSDHERMIVSYHEIGRALVAALQTHSAPVAKITIIPRSLFSHL